MSPWLPSCYRVIRLAVTAVTSYVSPCVDAPTGRAVERSEVGPGGRAEVFADAQPAATPVGAVPVEAGDVVAPRAHAGRDATVLPYSGAVVADAHRHVGTDGESKQVATQVQRLAVRRRRQRGCCGDGSTTARHDYGHSGRCKQTRHSSLGVHSVNP